MDFAIATITLHMLGKQQKTHFSSTCLMPHMEPSKIIISTKRSSRFRPRRTSAPRKSSVNFVKTWKNQDFKVHSNKLNELITLFIPPTRLGHLPGICTLAQFTIDFRNVQTLYCECRLHIHTLIGVVSFVQVVLSLFLSSWRSVTRNCSGRVKLTCTKSSLLPFQPHWGEI